MALHKGLLNQGGIFPDGVEKHFHDTDETWLILRGRGMGYWIDHQGQRVEFVLEAGDVFVIPVGYEHGSDGPNSDDFTVASFLGSMPPECHQPGHYYMEQEGYIPSFELKKTPTNRYRSAKAKEE